MRFSVFLALLVATFIACTTYASAENIANDVEVRRLKADAAPVAPVENAAKNAAGFISKLKGDAALTKGVQRVMAANGDEQAIRAAMKMYSQAAKSATISDDAITKLSASMAVAAKKNPKSWPRLRKFAKITLGAGVSALAIYGAYKLLTKDSTSTTTATTTV